MELVASAVHFVKRNPDKRERRLVVWHCKEAAGSSLARKSPTAQSIKAEEALQVSVLGTDEKYSGIKLDFDI